MPVKNDIIWRIAVIYFGVLLVAIVIIGKVFVLQVIEKEKWAKKAKSVSHSDIIIPARRGDICDENGMLLASSVPDFEIRMDLNKEVVEQEIFDNKIDSLALSLSNLFRDKSKWQYKNELVRARKNEERYFLIRRNVTFDQLQKIKTFPIFRRGRFKGGLITESKTLRKKPFINLASRTIGYISKAEEGNIVGIEGAYDNDLKGIDGMRLERRLAGGLWVPEYNGKQINPKDGLDVITTININIQDIAENALYRQLIRHSADHGCAVVMDVKTGDIKAIANLGIGNDKKSYNEIYNYAIGASTEPGSTFKLPVIMAALEDGVVDLDDSIDTGNGEKNYYGELMKDHHEGGFGKISVQEIFEKSSNIGVSSIINDNYLKRPQKFIDRLYRMSINEKHGLKIKGEGSPKIPDPNSSLWSMLSLPWMAHGYEVEMTPLQILTFYNAVANDGKMMKPRFVKYLRDRSRIVKYVKTEVINHSICSKGTVKKAKIMLEGVIERGTGTKLASPDYKIAGKTGTAQIYQGALGYKVDGKANYRASFVGYFPADAPKYSCIVMISRPTSGYYYGGDVAGVVFKEIADKVYSSDMDLQQQLSKTDEITHASVPGSLDGYKYNLNYILGELKIPYDNQNINSDWVVTTKNENLIKQQNRIIQNEMVPYVIGMGIRDAIYLLERAGLKVIIKGKGVVKKQSIPQGSTVSPGRTIWIDLA